jgi:AcrR family transcriptional regulator
MMRNRGDATMERIIAAAEHVVVETGAGHLTFEAVASKAGVSRGALLYHFPNKNALLRGILDRQNNRTAETRSKKRLEIPEGPEQEIVAYVLSLLDDNNEAKGDVIAALIAVAAHDPAILGPTARENYRQIMADVTGGGLRFERAAVITLAVHGLMFLETLSMSPFNGRERRAILNEFLAMTKDQIL